MIFILKVHNQGPPKAYVTKLKRANCKYRVVTPSCICILFQFNLLNYISLLNQILIPEINKRKHFFLTFYSFHHILFLCISQNSTFCILCDKSETPSSFKMFSVKFLKATAINITGAAFVTY